MQITRIAILDTSGSMNGPFCGPTRPGVITRVTDQPQKLEAAKDYIRFAIQRMPPESDLILISFDTTASVVYHGPSDDSIAIENAIHTLRANGSSTNLGAAFELVIDLVAARGHAIRPIDVVTDGMSNAGDPIEPARRLRKEFGAYIHLYLIDPNDEATRIANDIVGRDGEGEVDPITSSGRLRDRGRDSVSDESDAHAAMHRLEERHAAARRDFSRRTSESQRPKITAAYPECISSQAWSTVDVFVYLSEFQKLVRQETERLQHRENVDYSGASTVLPKSLPEGCPIRIVVNSCSLRANPSEVAFAWYEPYNRMSFRICPIDKGRVDYPATLDVDVFADDLLVASMRLPIMVRSHSARNTSRSATSDTQWYEMIFASYAREDFEIVKHLKERYEALGLYLFIDIEDIRAGAYWKSLLFDRIDSSDLFQLFWSTSAQRSKFVRAEYEHALRAQEVKGGRFIRPIYWEDPIPPIPVTLNELSFRRIAFGTQ